MVDEFKFERLRQAMDGDGSDVRKQLILAGLLLMIFERFKSFVVDRVDGFFAQRVEIKDGELIYIRGAQFKALIKEKGKGVGRQHRNHEFRAALRWLQELGAISLQEFDEVERLYLLRNEIGHELLLIVADDRKTPLSIMDVITVFGTYHKIVQWWIKEVEVATNPDLNEKDYESIDGTESADTAFLRVLINQALAPDDEWAEIIKVVQEQNRTNSVQTDSNEPPLQKT